MLLWSGVCFWVLLILSECCSRRRLGETQYASVCIWWGFFGWILLSCDLAFKNQPWVELDRAGIRRNCSRVLCRLKDSLKTKVNFRSLFFYFAYEFKGFLCWGVWFHSQYLVLPAVVGLSANYPSQDLLFSWNSPLHCIQIHLRQEVFEHVNWLCIATCSKFCRRFRNAWVWMMSRILQEWIHGLRWVPHSEESQILLVRRMIYLSEGCCKVGGLGVWQTIQSLGCNGTADPSLSRNAEEVWACDGCGQGRGAMEDECDVVVFGVIDPKYEFSAPQYYDFEYEETQADVEAAERWFFTAITYEASRAYCHLCCSFILIAKPTRERGLLLPSEIFFCNNDVDWDISVCLIFGLQWCECAAHVSKTKSMAELFTAAADNNLNGKNHDEAIKVQILLLCSCHPRSSWPWLIMFVSSTLQAIYCTRRTCLQFFYISFAPMWIVVSFILLLQILAHVSPKPAIKPCEEEYADAAPASFFPPVFGNHISFLSDETFAPNDPEVLFSSLGCLYSLV